MCYFKSKILYAFCVALISVFFVRAVFADVDKIDAAEESQWIECLIPCPREIKISAKLEPGTKKISLRTNHDGSPAARRAVTELQTLLKIDETSNPNDSDKSITLIAGLLGTDDCINGRKVEDAARLRQLPNSDQAYMILPQGDNALLIVALSAQGLYYGVQTFKQLITPFLASDRIVIPLATITDWPDMRERGFWNMPPQMIPHKAALKMNFITSSCRFRDKFTRDQPMRMTLDDFKTDDGTLTSVLDCAQQYAMTPYVKTAHYNYWQIAGLYATYPELAGQGAAAVPSHPAYVRLGRDKRVPCATNPQFTALLTDVMRDLAMQGVPEIAPWLTEFQAQCQCERCLLCGQLQAEVDATLAAWRAVRKDYPNIKLRIFFSLGHDDSQATRDCLANLPPEVMVEKVYGIQPPYIEAAARGMTVISYSGFNFLGLDKIGLRRYAGLFCKRIQSGYNDKLSGVLSINYMYCHAIPYFSRIHDYNICAVAEWSWNVNGRSLREFAVAWARRAGYKDPEKFADWAEAIETVEELLCRRGIYDHTSAANSLKTGQPQTIFKDQAIADALETCRRILPPTSNPEPKQETDFIIAALHSHEKLNALCATAAGYESSNDTGRDQLQAALEAYCIAVHNAADALDPLLDTLTIEPTTFIEKTRHDHKNAWLQNQHLMREAVEEFLQRKSNTH